MPLLLKVPLFVNDPLKVCDLLLPLKLAPDATLNAVFTVQSILEETPLVLLMFAVAYTGLDVETIVGATVPLKFIIFRFRVAPEFWKVCAEVPVKVVVPVLVKVPLFVKSPLMVNVPAPPV